MKLDGKKLTLTIPESIVIIESSHRSLRLYVAPIDASPAARSSPASKRIRRCVRNMFSIAHTYIPVLPGMKTGREDVDVAKLDAVKAGW